MEKMLMANFFGAYKNYVDLSEETENFLDDHTDMNGEISKADEKIFNEKMKALKLMKREVKKAYNKLEPELAKPMNKPILNYPQNQMFETTEKFGVASENYHRAFFNEVRSNFKTAMNYLNEGNDAQGGYLVPSEFHEEIITQLQEENILRQIGNVITTATDREIAIQATAPTAAFVAEGQQIPLSTEEFERKTLKAYKLAAGVSVSNELLSDSFYDIESHLQSEFGKAIASREENAFLNGTGTGEPKGLIPTLAADTDSTITTARSNIASDEMIDLAYTLPRPYRKNACWLMSDSTLAVIRKLKDSTQNYLWERNFSLNEPPTILGFPVYTSEYMPSIASGKIPVLFGDFSKYIIGQRGELRFKPLYELHALQDMTSYLMIERVDAVLADRYAIRGIKMR